MEVVASGPRNWAFAVTWEIRRLGGQSEDPAGSQAIKAGNEVSDGLGQATVRIEPLPTGDYEAVARRQDDDAENAAEARRVFRVDLESRELERVDAEPGTELMSALASETGGRALRAAQGDTLPPDLPLGQRESAAFSRVESRREVKLWSSGWTLLVLLLALPGEWLLRRRYGRT